MKKSIIIFSLLSLVIAMTACSIVVETELEQDQAGEVTPPAQDVKLVPMTFTASYSYDGVDEEETKTVLNGFKIEWKKAYDKIAVFDNVDSNVAHEFTAESDGETTTFTGSVAAGATKFFAVYPYSAAEDCSSTPFTEGSTEYNGYMNVSIPNVQTPVPGSFDPKAAVLVACSGESVNALNFKIPFAIVKFTVDYDDIYSVSFSAEEDMTGSIKTSMRANGNINVDKGEGTVYKGLTIKNGDNEPLVSGATYYAVVRYRTGDYAYTTFTAELGNTGCGYAQRIASKRVGLERASVNNLGNFSGMTFTTNRYKGYEDGLTIIIGDKSFRKADLGTSRLLTARTLSNAVVNEQGVTFLTGGEYPYATEIALSKDVILIGNGDSEAKLIGSGGDDSKAWKLISGSLSLNSLLIDISTYTKNGFACNKDATGDYSLLEINGCNIAGGYPVFFQNGSKYGMSVAKIRIVNSIYSTGRATQIINIPSATSSENFTSIEFNNNLVYSRTPSSTFNCDVLNGKTSGVETSSVTSITMNNNLFVNTVSSGGAIKFFDVASLSITDNILWDGNSYDLGGSTSAKLITLQNTAPANLASFTLGGNIGIGLATGKAFRYSSGTLATNIKSQFSLQDLLKDNPFTSSPVVNLDGTIDIDLLDAYSAIGPQIDVPM